MDWIRIEGGPFTMGLRTEQAERLQELYGPTPFPFHREMPAHPVELAPFLIARAPVTNAEYLEFVEASGYDRDDSWEALLAEPEFQGRDVRSELTDQAGWPGPLTWSEGRPPAGLEEHPVSGVSWYEAHAYCRFRGCRLPLEAEWELAARGADASRLYPWGAAFERDRCPSREAGSLGTAPVGSFPAGQSPFGVLDAVGNVAQWCEERYQPYPGHGSAESIGPLDHVVRGDFYWGTPESLRATVRTARFALDRFPGLGFRCARPA